MTTPKPDRVHVNIANFPAALTPLCNIAHWVVWRWELRKRKWTKPPYMPSAPCRKAKNNDPSTWDTYEAAVRSLAHADGIGFDLLDTPFDVVDLDHCRDPDTGEIDGWAKAWLHTTDGVYVEVTPSGEGLRIIGLGEGEKVHRKFKISDEREGAAIEIYRSCERYITVTGAQVGECTALATTNGLLGQIQAHYENDAKDNRTEDGDIDFNDAGKQGGAIDYDAVIRNGAPDGTDVSAVFHSVVGYLHAKDMTVGEIVEELGQHVNGISQRYAGRLRQAAGGREIVRQVGKEGPDRGAGKRTRRAAAMGRH